MTRSDSVPDRSSAINQAASVFAQLFNDRPSHTAISLAAQMSGLQLLRASGINLSRLSPGDDILGAVSGDTFEVLQEFIDEWAFAHDLDPDEVGGMEIPENEQAYLPEISQLEPTFLDICQKNAVQTSDYPFVAAMAALDLVSQREESGQIESNLGLAITMAHIVLGSSSAPYPIR